jgi:hypothetical protein
MTAKFEAWAGRTIVRDDEGQFAESAGSSWIERLSDRIDRQPSTSDGEPLADWQRGRWRVATRENERAKLVEQVRRDVHESDDLATWRASKTPEELEDLIQQQADAMLPPGAMRSHTEYRNGPHAVHVPVGLEGVPLAEMLATADELVSRNPPPGRRTFRIAEADPIDRPTQHAYTSVGGNSMIINPRVFDPVEAERIRSEMPSAHLVPHHVWVMIHEYGHTLYPGKHEDTGPIWDVANEALKADPNDTGMSLDATLRGPHEIFAEAFAEWFVTNGTTSSIYAKKFAERFGW